MKTVMKKMFCLMLVAVLLVSAVPAAFAEGGVFCTKDDCTYNGEAATRQSGYDVAPTCSEAGKIGYYCQGGHKVYDEGEAALGHDLDDGVITKEPTCKTLGKKTYTCTRGCGFTKVEDVPAVSHTYVDANCNDPKTCSACGHVKDGSEALGHDWAVATCTAPKTCKVCGDTEGEALGHSYGTGSICATCKNCKLCNETINEVADHAPSCKLNPDYESTCDKCGEKYVTTEGHDANDCKVCLVCWDKGDTGVRSHKTADHCAKCGKTDGTHKTSCEKAVCSICNGAHETADCPNDGDYDLKIYATMWTGDVREETVYLGTFKNLTKSTKIGQYMDENETRIHNWVAERCSGYAWRDGNIFEDKNSSNRLEWNDAMGYKNREAYINVKRDSKDVVLFLHTSRTYVDHDWIKVEGKTTNDTLTLDEAKAIVKKYYSFSSLKMYSNDDWNEYVAGNNNITSVGSVEIGSGNVTKIHILMSGSSAKTSSGTSSTSKADSSNPKTGDAIFAPVAVMGLSVSALAVLYFLNKKRAY